MHLHFEPRYVQTLLVWGTNSAVLAHWMLNEKLNIFGMLGCVLCITGSLTIVLHAPEEQPIHSLVQLWLMAMQPGESHLAPAVIHAYSQRMQPAA